MGSEAVSEMSGERPPRDVVGVSAETRRLLLLAEILDERVRQDKKWGEQNHPDGTGPRVPFAGRLCYMADMAQDARGACQAASGEVPGLEHHGPVTWRHILLEEVFEALAEDDPVKLDRELDQIAAVCLAWREARARRRAAELAGEG